MKYLCFFILSFSLYASNFDLITDQSSISMTGTSTFHDWTMESSELKGEADLIIKKEMPKGIKALKVQLRVESLKSDSEGLDEKAYEALKSKEHPSITFEHLKMISINDKEIAILGKLQVSGVQKEVTVKGKIINIEKDFLSVEGEHDLKMSDFKIEPPSAMLGMVTSGDELKIKFNVIFRERK